jgi:hypothetical protein
MPIQFTAEARAKFDDQAYFDELEECAERLTALRMGQVDPDESPVAKIPMKVAALLQVGIRRILELTESFVSDVNAGRYTPPFISARATVETACLMYSAIQRVREANTTRDLSALEEFDERIMKMLVGGKSREWAHPDEYEAVNVLTVIQHLTKRIPQLTSMYELLCEYAHPNYSGMMGAYSQIRGGALVFADRPTDAHLEEMKTAVGMVGLALDLAARSAERYREALPAFIRLCESQIHARGTWPAGVPYPRE